MITEEIKKSLQEVLAALAIPVNDISVEQTADQQFGDYTTNVAMIAAKKAGRNPRELAQEIISQVKIQDSRFKKIDVAGPGFINFWLSKEALIGNLSNLLEQKKRVIPPNPLKGKHISVEFTDPNPFKEFHIGHLYSNIVGESVSRLMEFAGAIVWRADYFGDVGMHVAKTLWGLEQKFSQDKIDMDKLAQLPLEERIKYLGQAYAYGATAYEENEEAKGEMKRINRLVYLAAQKMWQEKKGLEPQVDYVQGHQVNKEELDHIYYLYIQGREWSLDYFETIYGRLGTKFNGYYPESIAGERGYALVNAHVTDGVFEQSNGAIVFPEKQSGLHTRVFINQLGLPTYEVKELGLAPWKYEEFPYDLSIIVTGNEINEYFKVLLAAMLKVNPKLGEKTMHIGHGMVRLPEGKMSSRTGKIKTGESLLDQAREEALKLLETTSGEKNEELAEIIGQAAVKYALLRQNIGKDVTFNFAESINFDGNSGPYLQYTFARTQSVIHKSKIKDQKSKINLQPRTYNLQPEELLVLRTLYKFEETVIEAAEKYSPNILATYLYNLAQQFNFFYQKLPILKAEGESRDFRLLLTATVGETIKRGLDLLGIKAPERM